jgi:subtilase family serine protease
VRPVSFLLVALLTAFVSAQASASSSGLGGNSGQGYGPQHPLAWTSSKTPENVSFILLPQNLSGLEQQVNAGMPNGYLSVSQFAARYGQTQANIAELESYLTGYGISSTVMANDLDVQATGTAGQFNKALSVTQHDYAVTGSDGETETVHAADQAPLLPPNLAQFVQAIFGLSNYPIAKSDTAHSTLGMRSAAAAGTPGNGDLMPAFFSSHYNLSPLLNHGATGADQTIGIIALAGFNPSDAQYFWSQVGAPSSPSRIQVTPVDGGSTSDGLETSIDVEQAGVIAPQATVKVYEAPNSSAGYIDSFFLAASDDTADAVSASWGSTELVNDLRVANGWIPANSNASFDEAFLELAAQGQSAFNSSGDDGAFASWESGITNLDDLDPSASPWITSAGGTTVPFDWRPAAPVVVPAERTWAWDYVWPDWQFYGAASEASWAEGLAHGSGGGFSSNEAEPAYQQGVPGTNTFSAITWLTPTDFQTQDGYQIADQWKFNPSPTVIQGTGTGRATPDLAANADPESGYEVYDTPQLGGWGYYWGGTSFVAPQLAAATAVINSYVGHRVGFWNTSIYRFAKQNDSPFTPLDTTGASNDNLYYTGTPGNVYNVGSGLGIPDLARLAADFGHG